jgi:GTPase SAR1 family protein
VEVIILLLEIFFTLYLQAWLGEINEYAQEDVVIMLLGNKADMANERMIRTEDGEKLARNNNVSSEGLDRHYFKYTSSSY